MFVSLAVTSLLVNKLFDCKVHCVNAFSLFLLRHINGSGHKAQSQDSCGKEKLDIHHAIDLCCKLAYKLSGSEQEQVVGAFLVFLYPPMLRPVVVGATTHFLSPLSKERAVIGNIQFWFQRRPDKFSTVC